MRAERERIAFTLHDHAVQEIAYVVSQTRSLVAAAPEDERLQRLARAAERALFECRAAITGLSPRAGGPLATALERAARMRAERAGLELELDLALDADLDPRTREALLSIACEAISNAARHAGAARVAVELDAGPPLRLAIRDDGAGFDPAGPPAPGSFGLVSMRERATAVGGELRLRSAPGEGTLVEVLVP